MSTGTRLPVSRSYAVQAVTAYNRAKNGDGSYESGSVF